MKNIIMILVSIFSTAVFAEPICGAVRGVSISTVIVNVGAETADEIGNTATIALVNGESRGVTRLSSDELQFILSARASHSEVCVDIVKENADKRTRSIYFKNP